MVALRRLSFYDVYVSWSSRLRIWFDIVTPKQVLFFRPVIEAPRRGRSRGPGDIEEVQGGRAACVHARARALLRGGEGREGPARAVQAQPREDGATPPNGGGLLPGRLRLGGVSRLRQDLLRAQGQARRRERLPPLAGRGEALAPSLSSPDDSLDNPVLGVVIFGVSWSQVSRYRALDPAAWLKGRPRRASGDSQRKGEEEGHHPGEARGVLRPIPRRQRRVMVREGPREARRDFKGNKLVALCRYEDQLDSVRKRFGLRVLRPRRRPSTARG